MKETNKQDKNDMRAAIDFRPKEKWCAEKALFTSDALTIGGHSVMERWETEYMRVLAEIVTRQGGRILEIGFGLGIASAFIEMNDNTEQHDIIDCHPDVLRKCRETYRAEITAGKMLVHEGFGKK